jgi:hypothetical protein
MEWNGLEIGILLANEKMTIPSIRIYYKDLYTLTLRLSILASSIPNYKSY